MRRNPRSQSGFTIVELIIVTCIIAVVASIAIKSLREYSRRASMSEILMAGTRCKTMVSESYPTFDSVPPAGGWGCEGSGGATKYAGGVSTSQDGVIRIAITNVDMNMNGHYVFLVPTRADGATPMTSTSDLGNGVRGWICGSDLSFVRNSLPASCRTDTTTFSTQTFSP